MAAGTVRACGPTSSTLAPALTLAATSPASQARRRSASPELRELVEALRRNPSGVRVIGIADEILDEEK
jgi:hypothetical protein